MLRTLGAYLIWINTLLGAEQQACGFAFKESQDALPLQYVSFFPHNVYKH